MSQEQQPKLTPRNRVKELRMVPPWQIRENPKNWRIHPEHQRQVMQEALNQFGIADAMLAYERDDGKGKKELVLLDGHLRKSQIDENLPVPVLVLDVDDREADGILATHDAIGAMAVADEKALTGLLGEMSGSGDALASLADGVKDGLSLFEMQDLTTDLTVGDEVIGDYKPQRPILVLKFDAMPGLHRFLELTGYGEDDRDMRTLRGEEVLERLLERFEQKKVKASGDKTCNEEQEKPKRKKKQE